MNEGIATGTSELQQQLINDYNRNNHGTGTFMASMPGSGGMESNSLQDIETYTKRINTPGTPEYAYMQKQIKAHGLVLCDAKPATVDEQSSTFWQHLEKQSKEVGPGVAADAGEALAAWIAAADDRRAEGNVVPQEKAAVKLVGLVKKAAFNGRTGTLEAAVVGSDGAQRWTVVLDRVGTAVLEDNNLTTTGFILPATAGQATSLSVRPANIVVIAGGRQHELDVVTSKGKTVLGQLCQAGGSDPVDDLRTALAYGCDPNQQCMFESQCGEIHKTLMCHPLTVATICGHHDSCKLLLEANANTANKDAIGYTALHHACKKATAEDEVKILKLLLDHGADTLDDNDGTVENVMRFAAKHNQVGAIEVLLEAGMDASAALVHASTNGSSRVWYRTPLMEAVQGSATEAALALIDAGASLTEHDSLGRTAFLLSCMHGNIEVADACLKSGVDFDIDSMTALKGACGQNCKPKTGLHFSALAGNLEMVTFLLENGADPSTKTKHADTVSGDETGLTALDLMIAGQTLESQGEAAREGFGINVEVRSVNRRRREFAAEHALTRVDGTNKAIIAKLLEHGASVASVHDSGSQASLDFYAPQWSQSPLFETLLLDCKVIERAVRAASKAGNAFALELLLKHVSESFDVAAQDADGMSALDLAASHGTIFATERPRTANVQFEDTVNLLLGSFGALLSKTQMKDWMESALWHAAHFGHADTARALLEHDAAVDINTFAGKSTTPLMESCTEGHFELVLLLLNRGADQSKLNEDGLCALACARDDAAVLMAWLVGARGCPNVDVDLQTANVPMMLLQLTPIAWFEKKAPSFESIANRYLLHDDVCLEGLGPRRQIAVKVLCKEATAAYSPLERTAAAAAANLFDSFSGALVTAGLTSADDLAESRETYTNSSGRIRCASITLNSFVNALGTVRSKPWSVSNHWLHDQATRNKVQTILLVAARFAAAEVDVKDRPVSWVRGSKVDSTALMSSLWLPNEIWQMQILPLVVWKEPSVDAPPPPAEGAAAPPVTAMNFSINVVGDGGGGVPNVEGCIVM